jgi:hypothetical protein
MISIRFHPGLGRRSGQLSRWIKVLGTAIEADASQVVNLSDKAKNLVQRNWLPLVQS